ncbi:MAG: heterodisulfide reductase-related iron-sulfur binding cluster, partial [Rhodospirillales bacterium]|nr:heterodisulfide reductase-related iron-sulfur binding cluster [Rhodospirillales bacterium]
MSEGVLGAPVRHALAWREADFTDGEKIDAELRRVFDICHGCRRCFNLCDSFPRLFDLIDESDTGELDSVASSDFKPNIDACTLCDMCFMTKCPYVPPHEFDLDFPHLMVRTRAAQFQNGEVGLRYRQLTRTDRNGKLAGSMAGLTNWVSKRSNTAMRGLMELGLGVHRDADLPPYQSESFASAAAKSPPEINADAPAHGRKAVLYATCFVNYNNSGIGRAARSVLARNGVETQVSYVGCCGMPQLEHGDLAQVAENAKRVTDDLIPWIEKGYDVIALVPSCALMFKFEWPLILPENENIKRLAGATSCISE